MGAGPGGLYIVDPPDGVDDISGGGEELLWESVSTDVGLYVTAAAGAAMLVAGAMGLTSG